MNLIKRITVALLFVIAFSCAATAQGESPVTSLDKISLAMNAISAKYLAYMSTVAHSNKIRKAEKRRQELLNQIDKSRYAVVETPYYKGDKSLHESTIAYMKIASDVMNENYAKVVNLEDIAEQSYDNMEAYILLKKSINEKMNEAEDKRYRAVEEYCKKYNINLVKDQSEMGEKLKKVDKVMDYYNNIYLIFFKCSVQDNQLIDALEKKNITAIEQIKGSLVKYADEGLARLDTTKTLYGDASLKSACRSALSFFKTEAGKITVYTDYFMKEESFNQVKKNFESNSSAQNSKVEIDKFNKAVNEANKTLQQYNQTNDYLNQSRDATYKNWNSAVDTYMDNNVPYAK